MSETSETSELETIEKLKSRLLRERSKREQLQAFVDQKTRQLAQEKERFELFHKISMLTNGKDSFPQFAEALATTLFDFQKFEYMSLLVIDQVQGESDQLTNISYRADQCDPIFSNDNAWITSDLQLELIELSRHNQRFNHKLPSEQSTVYFWCARVNEKAPFLLLVASTSKQKFLSVDDSLVELCQNQCTIAWLQYHRVKAVEQTQKVDSLTLLNTESVFLHQLQDQIDQYHDQPYSVAMIAIDIADMGLINQEHGNAVGNSIIKTVAEKITKLLRESDCITRHNGDGFLIYLLSDNIEMVVANVTQRIIRFFNEPIKQTGLPIALKLHIGYCIEEVSKSDTEHLVKHAEVALKTAKSSKSSPLRFEQEMLAKAKQARNLDITLRDAIENEEFRLFYQPIVNLNTMQIEKAEALIRWQRDGETIVPVQFIPHLEESGLIIPVGRWIIDQALSDLRTWQKAGSNIRSVCVNLSTKQFEDTSLHQWVQHCLTKHAISSESLTLEVTESFTLSSEQGHDHLIHQLRDMNVKIALDDFGTGYSSLSYLYRYTFDILKIDRSFIVNLDTGERSHKLLQSIVGLSSTFEMDSVAEGIETIGVVRLLQHMGINYGQGYYFSRPVPAEDFAKML